MKLGIDEIKESIEKYDAKDEYKLAAGTIISDIFKDKIDPEEAQVAEVTEDSDLQLDIRHALNKYSRENNSGTPDFILAGYMLGCLEVFERTTRERAAWYGESVSMINCPTIPEAYAPNPK